MIELTVLNHSYDEERLGFGEPDEAPSHEPVSWTQRCAVAAIALGVLIFLLTSLAGFIPGEPLGFLERLRGTWAGWLASLGLMSVGTTLVFIVRYKGTTPGIKHNDTTFRNVQSRGWLAWGVAVFLTGFYVVLYWYGDLTANGMAPLLEGPIRMMDPLALALTGSPADHWFLYGVFYTLLILVFGVRMIMRYRHNRYHLIRTGSVMFFQLGFAFLLPGFLKAMNQPEFYFTYFWPLKPNYAWPGDVQYYLNASTLGVFMVGFGVFAILVLTPVLTYFFGKRWYCSWVCGCGGLAETLGDPWRQLSSKKSFAWVIERWLIHSVLVVVILVTALLWVDHMTSNAILGDAALTARKWYGFLIVAGFAGVVGVGFYPLMGSRVWCRFGCPMAAILGLLQRYFSRFRITTNGSQCMSCGNCSTYCEMGIDVRAYAQRGENIVRASCVGCGVCAAVCPRGVLKLENGAREGRYPSAGGPLDQVIADIRRGADAHRAG